MRRAEDDVLAYKSFPRDHWVRIHSTDPLERLNKEIKRRTNVVGIFPNEAAVTRLVGALMLEQNDEWAITRRNMTLAPSPPFATLTLWTRRKAPPCNCDRARAEEQSYSNSRDSISCM